MRAGAVRCLFLLAFALGNDPVRASGGNRGLPTDDKVAIVSKHTELLFGSCPKGPAPTANVRLQALKTKSGAIFRRNAVTDNVFNCLAALGSQTLAARNIRECSNQAEAAGLKMFRWDGAQCTGYTSGIPLSISRCAGAGSVVLYSVDVEEAQNAVVSNLTIAFSNYSTINAAWDDTSNSCFVSYRVSFNNHDTFVSDKLATLSLETPLPCTEYPLTVTPVDVMGPSATLKLVTPKGLKLVLNLTFGLSAVKASWGFESTCDPKIHFFDARPVKSYSISLGYQHQTLDNSTFEFTIGKFRERCSDTASNLTAYHNNVTLQALDDTDAELVSSSATLADTNLPGHRYQSDSYNCIYYQKVDETPGGVGFTYDQLREFCQKTIFSEPFNGAGGIFEYYSDLTYWESNDPKIILPAHYLGVKRNSTSNKWVWSSGKELSVTDKYWDSGEPNSAAGDCAVMKPNKKISAVSCNATNMPAVCFDFLSS